MRIQRDQVRLGLVPGDPRAVSTRLVLIEENADDALSLANIDAAIQRRQVQGSKAPLSQFLAMEEGADIHGKEETETEEIERLENGQTQERGE